jgi:hypothetical protein
MPIPIKIKSSEPDAFNGVSLRTLESLPSAFQPKMRVQGPPIKIYRIGHPEPIASIRVHSTSGQWCLVSGLQEDEEKKVWLNPNSMSDCYFEVTG